MCSRTLALCSVVAALGIMGAACSSSPGGGRSPSASASGGSGGTITINGDKANNHGSRVVSGASSASLDAANNSSSFFFDPTVLTGKPGQKLTITVKNTGNTVHNFTLSGGGANKDVQPGQSAKVTVTFPNSGSMEFYCRFHRSFGMVGELTTS